MRASRIPPSAWPRPPSTELEPPGRDLVQHRLDELGLGLDVLAGDLLEGAQRPEHRGPGALAVEMVEPERVPVEVRDPALEGVEHRQRVLAQGEEDVDAEPPVAEQRRELRAERRSSTSW